MKLQYPLEENVKKINLIILIILLNFIYINNSFAIQNLDINSNCTYVLIDSKSGRVLAEKNADLKVRPASTTKIMTAIVALENGNLNQIMNVSREAVYDIGNGGMNIGILPKEDNLTLETLLNIMLIKSANETANIIAENVGGTREKFIEKMNQKAIEIGAINTHFVNPNGKDNLVEEANHLTTARDMAIIARYAMTISKFREIVSKEYFEVPKTNFHENLLVRTTNKFLWPENKYAYSINNEKYYYKVIGVKTGYTDKAHNNLITSGTNEDGLELISAVMHVAEGNNRINTYTKDILKYGFENYTNKKLIAGNQLIKTVDVNKAKDNKKLDIITQNDVMCALPLDVKDMEIKSSEHINLPIQAPIMKGDVLGYMEYELNGIKIDKVNLVASTSIELSPKVVSINSLNKNFGVIIPIIIFGLIIFVILKFAIFSQVVKRRRIKLRRKKIIKPNDENVINNI